MHNGVRVQAHRTADGAIELFTRRLERVSAQFPDVVASLAAGLGPRRSGRGMCPAGLHEKLISTYRSVASPASSTGTIAHATRYSSTPLPPNTARRTITSRTMFASMPL